MGCKICLHTTYETVEFALVLNGLIKDIRSVPKEKASSELIIAIDRLLEDNDQELSDVDSIIVNQGPAPFTTLRTIITTANGIAFATGIPLVGVDALQAFSYASAKTRQRPIVIMLNAFNKAIYYAVKTNSDVQPQTGYALVDEFMLILKTLIEHGTKFHVFGNGAALYATQLKEVFADHIIMQQPLKLVPSIADIIDYAAVKEAHNHSSSKSLEPLYLKKSV